MPLEALENNVESKKDSANVWFLFITYIKILKFLIILHWFIHYIQNIYDSNYSTEDLVNAKDDFRKVAPFLLCFGQNLGSVREKIIWLM